MTPVEAGHRFMAMALSLGARGQGNTWPNPAVGCVIVKDGHVVGRGWTQPGGRPHAEVMALVQAGDAAKGADVYVSLEPCAHTGQTPPCANTLADAGVARVVCAHRDPDPRTAGKGADILRRAGVEVVEDAAPEAAHASHLGFFLKVTERRPMVTLKLASSLDGRIATASGESRWITGPDARRFVHGLRLRHDAVLVGGGTARTDDPDLTVRGFGDTRQPVRVVLTRHLSLDPGCRLGATARNAPVWIIHGDADGDTTAEARDAWRATGAELVAAKVGPGCHIDPLSALQALADRGITRVLCEGGGALAASFLAAGMVDRLVAFGAGVAIGAEGQPSLGALGLDALADAPRLRLVDTRRIGEDVCTFWER